jgi:hypothetical protein
MYHPQPVPLLGDIHYSCLLIKMHATTLAPDPPTGSTMLSCEEETNTSEEYRENFIDNTKAPTARSFRTRDPPAALPAPAKSKEEEEEEEYSAVKDAVNITDNAAASATPPPFSGAGTNSYPNPLLQQHGLNRTTEMWQAKIEAATGYTRKNNKEWEGHAPSSSIPTIATPVAVPTGRGLRKNSPLSNPARNTPATYHQRSSQHQQPTDTQQHQPQQEPHRGENRTEASENEAFLATALLVEEAQVATVHVVPPNSLLQCLPNRGTVGGRRLCFGIVLAVMMVLGAIAIVGILCGTAGTCSPSPDDEQISRAPSMQPSTASPTTTSRPTPTPTDLLPVTVNTFATNYTASDTTAIELVNVGLSGTIPTEIRWLSTLTMLDLRENGLVGTLPTELGSLSALTFLGLGGNKLSGPVPKELGSLTALTFLSLEKNQLTRSLPSGLGSLTALTSFVLYGNQLTGHLPTELGSLTTLTDMRLFKNQLTGTLPTELGSLTALTLLGLEENRLTGPLPTELGSLTALTWLSLWANQLTGTLPSEFGSLTAMFHLSFGYNELTGTVPSSVCSISSLTLLSIDCEKIACNCSCRCG